MLEIRTGLSGSQLFIFCAFTVSLLELEEQARSQLKLAHRDSRHAVRLAQRALDYARRRHRHCAACVDCLIAEAMFAEGQPR